MNLAKRRYEPALRSARRLIAVAALGLFLCPMGAMSASEMDRLDTAPRPQTGPGAVQGPVFVIPDSPGTTVVRPGREADVVTPPSAEPGTVVPVEPQALPAAQVPEEELPAREVRPEVVVPVKPETPPALVAPDATAPPKTVQPEGPAVVAPREVTPQKPVVPVPSDDPRSGAAQPGKTPPTYYTPGDFLVVTPIPDASEAPRDREDDKTPPPAKPEAKKPEKKSVAPEKREKEPRPEKQPVKPDPQGEKKPMPAPQPSPSPKAQTKPRSGEPLRIPPEAVKSGKLDFLEGCWVATRPEYYSKRTIRERWCFDKNGVGKRFIKDPQVADRCVGAARARLEGEVLHVSSEGAYCSAGMKWGASRMTCRGVGGKTPCSWVFTDANGGTQAYDIPFYRE